jgi:two-component system, NtrC family, sensor kinase
MKEVSELVAVLAHEMRTPISAILGYQELLADGIYGSVDQRGRESLDRIAYSAYQLLHLIDGVQEISVPGARLSRNDELFDPLETLRECIENAHPDATGRSIEIVANLPEQLPQMSGDSDMFGRAFDLAFGAAIKTTYNARVQLNVSHERNQIVAVIKGSGLSAERDDPRFVEPGRGKLTGAGLRLAIVKHIAQRLGGELQLTSAPEGAELDLHFKTSD